MEINPAKNSLNKRKDLAEELNLTEVFFKEIHWERIQYSGKGGHRNQIPAKRWGHKFFKHNEKIYMLGGNIKRNSKVPCALYQLDMTLTPPIWTRMNTEGKGPKSIDSHTLEKYDNFVYTFCGNVDNVTSNRVYRLDLDNLLWEKTDILFKTNRESHIGFKLTENVMCLHGGISGTRNGHTLPMGDELMVAVDVRKLKWKKVCLESKVKGKGPGERESHNVTSLRGDYFVYGGMSLNFFLEEAAIQKEESKYIEVQAKKKRSRRNLRDLYMKQTKMVIEVDQEEKTEVEVKVEKEEDDGMMIEVFDNQMVEEKLEDIVKEEESVKIEEEFKEEEEEKEVKESDYLDDLYQLKILVLNEEELDFELEWTQIRFKGKIPHMANFCFFSEEKSKSLIFLGGEGYRLGIEYEEEDRGETLDQIYYLNLQEKLAFEVKDKKFDPDGFNTASGFMHNGDYFIYGGLQKDDKHSSKLYRLKIQMSNISGFEQSLGNLGYEKVDKLCDKCTTEWNDCLKYAQKPNKSEKKDIDSRVKKDKVDYSLKEFPNKFINIDNDVLEDFGEMLLHDQSEFAGAFTLGNAILDFIKKRDLYKVRFEVSKPNLFMMGIMEKTQVHELIEGLEDDIVSSELYKLALFAKELKGAMRLYFRFNDGYYTFSTPLINDRGDDWIENTRMELKYFPDIKTLDNPMNKYLKRYDFFILFGFPIENRYIRSLNFKKGEIWLPIPKSDLSSALQKKEKDEVNSNPIYWNLRYFFNFYFRSIDNDDLEIVIAREKMNLKALAEFLRGMKYYYKYHKEWKSHMIIYELNGFNDINKSGNKIYQCLRGKHTSLSYNEENLEQCKQYLDKKSAILFLTN